MQLGGYVPLKYDVSTGIPSLVPFPGISLRVGEQIPEKVMNKVIDNFETPGDHHESGVRI